MTTRNRNNNRKRGTVEGGGAKGGGAKGGGCRLLWGLVLAVSAAVAWALFFWEGGKRNTQGFIHRRQQEKFWELRDKAVATQAAKDRAAGWEGCPAFDRPPCRVPKQSSGGPTMSVMIGQAGRKLSPKYWEGATASADAGYAREGEDPAQIVYRVDLTPAQEREVLCGGASIAMNDLWVPRGHTPPAELEAFRLKEKSAGILGKGGKVGTRLLHEMKVNLAHQTGTVEGLGLEVPQTRAIVEGRVMPTVSEQDRGLLVNYARGVERATLLAQTPISDWREGDLVDLHAAACPGVALAHGGKWRRIDVLHGEGTMPPMGAELPELMSHFILWLKHVHGANCRHPLELACDAALLFNSLHPFRDCNGRTSRLLMAAVLLHHHILPPSLDLTEDLNDLIAVQSEAYFGDRSRFQRLVLMNIQNSFGLYTGLDEESGEA